MNQYPEPVPPPPPAVHLTPLHENTIRPIFFVHFTLWKLTTYIFTKKINTCRSILSYSGAVGKSPRSGLRITIILETPQTHARSALKAVAEWAGACNHNQGSCQRDTYAFPHYPNCLTPIRGECVHWWEPALAFLPCPSGCRTLGDQGPIWGPWQLPCIPCPAYPMAYLVSFTNAFSFFPFLKFIIEMHCISPLLL